MTEDQLEQEALGWLAEAGYATLSGPDIAPDGGQAYPQNPELSLCATCRPLRRFHLRYQAKCASR